MTRTLLVLLSSAVVAATAADTTEHPTGTRITPPTVNVVMPRGIARGTTVELTVEGLNLARTSSIQFSEPGIKGRILRVKELPDLPDIRLGSNGTPSTVDLGPLPPRNQVTVEVDVSPDAPVGPVAFRLLTPLGTSPEGRFLVEPYYGEAPDNEPNDTPEDAFETFLPAILTGTISRPGDVDLFKIKVRDGEQLVFENGAVALGSTLQPLVAILAEDQKVLREFGAEGGREAAMFAHKFDKGGTYYIRIADFQESGRGSNFYRIKVGSFPLATSAYPLGIARGAQSTVNIHGWSVQPQVTLKGEPSLEDEDAVIFRPQGRGGESFAPVRVALGQDPEVESSGNNRSAATAQSVKLPVTLNGRIAQGAVHYFRFHAQKGEKVILEVNARRLGSELDSVIEVLDAQARPIERAVVRAVLETSLTLSDRDSVGRGIRIQSWNGFAVGDYFMVGSEIVRAEAMPKTPDDDLIVEGFSGQRLTFFGTSPEAHPVDQSFYKVQVYPPGTRLTPNGMPIVKLTYRNDDGGPGFGKDSWLEFTAPAEGDYLACLRDVRGLGGDDYAYRLNLRPPRPDFRVAVSPRNPNVPVGGTVLLTVTALRLDSFDGAIDVELTGLPAGVHASRGRIASGQVSTVILLSADPEAKLSEAAPLNVRATAQAGGHTLTHLANPEDKLKSIALMPQGDVKMTAETREIVLEPGKSATVAVSIQRQNGFGGRVPVEVRNLPPRVRVTDVGLNGVLLNEDETRRTFTLEALPNADPVDQWIYVAGAIETRSPLASTYAAPQAIHLVVKPGPAKAAALK